MENTFWIMYPKKCPTWFPKGTPKVNQKNTKMVSKHNLKRGFKKHNRTIMIFNTTEGGQSVVNIHRIDYVQVLVSES